MLFTYLCREHLIKNQMTFLNSCAKTVILAIKFTVVSNYQRHVVLCFVFMLLAFIVLLRVALVFVSPQFIDILPCRRNQPPSQFSFLLILTEEKCFNEDTRLFTNNWPAHSKCQPVVSK